jgi:tRNA (cytidine/uridine-2'-O-)-methyltransferase
LAAAATVTEARSDDEWRQGRALVEEYAASLGVDLSFQDFAHEIAQLAVEYGPPGGVFLLAQRDGAYVGCIGLRRYADDAGEIKRLYVTRAGRGHGVGRLLATSIIRRARELGYRRLLLDTLPSMTEAHALYQSLGFKATAPYRYNPVPGTSYLELDLGQHVADSRPRPAAMHVVLVHPEIHWNTGNAGRTCLAAGATLHLIEPLGFSLDDRQVKRAGLDYWEFVDLRVWPHWDAFERAMPSLGDAYFFSTRATRQIWDAPLGASNVVLVFGRETGGLPAELHARYAERFVTMPIVSPHVRSLNLSSSVAIAVYEVLRQRRRATVGSRGNVVDTPER